MKTLNNYYAIAFDSLLKNKANAEDRAMLNEGLSDSGYYIFPIDEEILKKDNLFRRFATVIASTKEDGKIVATVSSTKAKLMAEDEAYPEQTDKFREIAFGSYKIGSFTKIKHAFVVDNNFDVKDYLSGEFSRRFGKAEEELLIQGNGITEPEGLLSVAKTGATTTSITASSAYYALAELYFSVDKEYRQNSVWIMSDETAMMLRNVKDSTGSPLWNHTSDTIFGKPVLISPYMTDKVKPVLFGNLTYFWLIVRKPLSVKILNELYMNTGDIGYMANERIDSKLVRDDAVKVLELKTEV